MTQPAPATPPPPENNPDNRPHKPADDSEEVYYQGTPCLRGEIGSLLLWFLIGLALIALPFIYSALKPDHSWPYWWVTLALIVIGLICFSVPWIRTKFLHYRISNYRIDCERGLLSRRIDTLEL